jgi:hypothetical protein
MQLLLICVTPVDPLVVGLSIMFALILKTFVDRLSNSKMERKSGFISVVTSIALIVAFEDKFSIAAFTLAFSVGFQAVINERIFKIDSDLTPLDMCMK